MPLKRKKFYYIIIRVHGFIRYRKIGQNASGAQAGQGAQRHEWFNDFEKSNEIHMELGGISRPGSILEATMQESAEKIGTIVHFGHAAAAGLRSKRLWQYFGGVKDLAGQKVPHGLGVKHFECERTQSQLSRVEAGRWVDAELEGFAEVVGFMCWICCEPTAPDKSKSGNKPVWGRFVGA